MILPEWAVVLIELFGFKLENANVTADVLSILQTVMNFIQSGMLFVSLVLVVWSNRHLARSQRLNTLQSMVSEMNTIRQFRAENTQLERALFDARTQWDDLKIQKNIMAVQLANVLEWAYIARRDNMLDKDVWESWVTTWRQVILKSQPLRESFTETVWTFGREPSMSKVLTDLVMSSGPIPDPRKSWFPARIKKFLGLAK